MCVTKGKVELHYGDNQVLVVSAGETCFIAKGEKFRPIFPVAGTEYMPVCLPAFKPELCLLEKPDDDDELEGKNAKVTTINDSIDDDDILYHLCPTELWEDA